MVTKTHTPGISVNRDLTKFRMVGILFSIAAGVWLAGCAGMERGRTETAQPLKAGQIRVATCQFPVSHDIRENAEYKAALEKQELLNPNLIG